MKIFLIFLYGCSSLDPYKIGVKTASKEILKSSRTISSREDFSILALKEMEMLLFPKAFSMNLKSIDRTDHRVLDKMSEEEQNNYFAKRVEYLKPIKFKIVPLVSDICHNLATKEGSRFDSHDFLIGREFNSLEKCLIIEIKRELPQGFGKKIEEIRRDDLLKTYLYIGENLKPFGKKIFLAVQMGRERFREVNILTSETDNMSSELDLIPIDLPNPQNFAVRGNILPLEEIRIPRDLFVMAMVSKDLSSCSKGSRIDFKDQLGNQVNIDWCQGQAWPKTMNTPRFFAILK